MALGAKDLEKLDDFRWSLPRQGEMRCNGLVLASSKLLEGMSADGCLDQLAAVASLPGIVGPALVMPDAHRGYGFPIGGVAAFDQQQGVISPGGVGYDINCGVRLLRSKLSVEDLGSKTLQRLADALFAKMPVGARRGGGLELSPGELDRVLDKGAAWAVERGFGTSEDLTYCEAGGRLPWADAQAVSSRALLRGQSQVGTLGSGNHFVELGQVVKIYDKDAAQAFGLAKGQLVAWVHSGSRGLGHQVCDDFLRQLGRDPEAVHPADRQLVAAPAQSPAGRQYAAAMAAAANFAFANRQILADRLRQVLGRTLGMGPAELGLGLVYDVAHNVAKQEKLGGRSLWIHRKGATRALGPGHEQVPSRYQEVGQPVLLPGDMGRASYVLAGTQTAMEQTFASAAHGAGRRLSRRKAKAKARGRRLIDELGQRGVIARAPGLASLAEEMPEAYKDAALVVETLVGSGVCRQVARLKPAVVIKG